MSASPDFFAMCHLPPGRAKVRVRWGMWEIVAARLVHEGALRWVDPERIDYSARGDDMTQPALLPSQVMYRRGCGREPDCFQPLSEAGYWPGNKRPEPLPAKALVGPRMWSATQRFDATAAAEEMEADREAARARKDEAAEPPEQQWWTNPFLVTYSEPGRISEREAEGRLMRALAAEWWVRVETPRCNTAAEALDHYAKALPMERGELAASDPVPAREQPSGRDGDDMLTALGWLNGVGAREDQILRLRGGVPAATWKAIGRACKVSDTHARRLYRQALAAVAIVANGGRTAALAEVQSALERLRTGNLRHRQDRRFEA